VFFLWGGSTPDNFWVTRETWYTPAPFYSEGYSVWYDPWIIEATAHVRGMDLSGYLDGVALMSPADLGKEVWIRRDGHDWEGPFLVVDCAQQNHMYAAVVNHGEVIT